MKTLLFLLALVILVGMLWIRLAPIDRDTWHEDPAEADDPGGAGVRLIGREAPRYPGEPETVLQTFADIALSEPRTRVLEGGPDEGMMTFVARTKLMGFPDLITVKVVSEGSVSKLAVISRARYGGSDWGVNRDRLDRWLQDMRLRLGQG